MRAALAVMAALPLVAACAAPAASGIDAPSGRETVPREGTDGEFVLRAGPFEDVFLLSGELKAVRSTDLVTPRSDTWRVQIKWLREDGSEVSEGDPLIEFDNTSAASRLEEVRLANLQAEINLVTRSAVFAGEREDRKLALERALFEEKKARLQASVPKELSKKSEWQEKQADLRRAEAEVTKARLTLEAFEISSRSEMEVLRIAAGKTARDIEETERMLDDLSIEAPRAGIFIVNENWREGRKYEVGDTVWPGQTVGSIPDLAEMEVRAWLSDVDDGQIAPGMSGRCVLDTYPDRLFDCRVEEVAALAGDEGFPVRLSLASSEPDLMRPGMSVRVEVVRGRHDTALAVPREAIGWDEGRAFVTLKGETDPVEVRLAACAATACLVEDGLSEGDRVLAR